VTKLIQAVAAIWQGADGATVEVIYDGDDRNAMERLAPIDQLISPKKDVALKFRLNDGSAVDLPFLGAAYLLPDRTGAVAIFEPGQYIKPDGTDRFPAPNNAAIFNADGSLRFQLIVPERNFAHRIAAFHRGAMPKKWEGYMGLLIATHPDALPEWVYAIDPSRPELISTGQWVRY
jgi:hypothetical protein